MLHQLISTRPTRVGRTDALLLSVAAHVVVIAALLLRETTSSWSTGEVVNSSPARIDRARHEPAVERIQYVRAIPRPHAADAPRSPMPVRHAAVPAAPLVKPLAAPTIGPIAVAEVPAIGDVTPMAKISDSLDFAAPVKLAESVKGVVNGGSGSGGKIGPYAADEVDKIVRPLPNNPKPVYPRVLQSQGVEGTFVVQFVVDSTGRVEEHSMSFPTDTHSLFVESVRRALKRSRYQPAEIAGRAVTQLVEQRFTFILVR